MRMNLYRCASVLAASVLVATVAGTDPARAATEPAAVTGTHVTGPAGR
jgi:hypothetical protein